MTSVTLFSTVQIKLICLSYTKVFNVSYIKQMTSVPGKENLTCFNIINQIWTITYCLWKLDTVTIKSEKKIHRITGHIFMIENIFIWINIAKFLSNTHLSIIYIIITVNWSEVPDHVKSTGMDHQINRDAERRVWSSDPRLSTRRDPIFRIKLLL